MRRYIQNDELSNVLFRIMHQQDPELIEVYRNVIRYRLAPGKKSAKKAMKMLQYPTRIVLCIFNLLLIPVISYIYMAHLSLLVDPMISFLFLGAVFAYSIYSGSLLIMLLATFHKCRSYILVDELFARRILILQKETSIRHAKAAK